MRPLGLALLVLAATASFASAASAQQCGNLVRAMSLDLEDGGNYFAVPVTVNGKPKQFLLDTGGAFSQISIDTVKEMGLKILPSRFEMFDMYGNTSAGQVIVDIGVGRQTVKNNETMVSGIRGVDGIFAADFMQNYDIDIDFAARKLNYFLTDHCPGRVVYWPAGIVAAVPFHGWNSHGNSHMNVTVKLDGHEMTALVDTGASDSTLDAGTAHALFDLPIAFIAVSRKAFDDFGVEKVWAEVLADNETALKSQAAAGFRREGYLRGHALKDGVFRDVVLLAINAAEWRARRAAVRKALAQSHLIAA